MMQKFIYLPPNCTRADEKTVRALINKGIIVITDGGLTTNDKWRIEQNQNRGYGRKCRI